MHPILRNLGLIVIPAIVFAFATTVFSAISCLQDGRTCRVGVDVTVFEAMVLIEIGLTVVGILLTSIFHAAVSIFRWQVANWRPRKIALVYSGMFTVPFAVISLAYLGIESDSLSFQLRVFLATLSAGYVYAVLANRSRNRSANANAYQVTGRR